LYFTAEDLHYHDAVQKITPISELKKQHVPKEHLFSSAHCHEYIM